MGSKGAMEAADKMGQVSKENTAAQTQANRPNINTAFGSQTWNQDPSGNWTMNNTLSAPQQGIFNNLQSGAGQLSGGLDLSPLNYGGLQSLTTGDQARRQATDAAYNQAKSRLDPQWQQRESSQKAELINQGLDPGSEAYQTQIGALGRERNDAYNGALNNAIGQGTQAGQALFGQSLLGRQQGMSELLAQKQLPMQQLGQLLGLQNGIGQVNTPSFIGANQAQTPDYIGANASDNAAWGGILGSLGGLAGGIGGLFGLGGKK